MLVECVPNFSEGRNAEVIHAIVTAARGGGAHVLDFSADADHHRMVVTMAGAPAFVMRSMLDAARAAVERIDLAVHHGQHPRIGAVDVVPFVPLREMSMEDAVALAREFGAQAAKALEVPVYLYGAAAARPERENLADIRRVGYEALRDRIGSDPELAPDFGPKRIGKAGAMVVGARQPLIAFNLFLDTTDIEIARAVAREIRAAEGGLPAVKALGLFVRGRAQVSVNLTDYRQTSLMSLVRAVEQAAARRSVRVVEAELIGLAPQIALLDAAVEALKLPPAARLQTIEYRLGKATGDFRPLFE